jgi:hypothetical protein
MKSAVDFLWDELECLIPAECQEAYVRAKKMEAKDWVVHYLFINKVSGVIGAEKTIDLLKETLNETK